MPQCDVCGNTYPIYDCMGSKKECRENAQIYGFYVTGDHFTCPGCKTKGHIESRNAKPQVLKCPQCGSKDVATKSGMMERATAMCYVTYHECAKCGNVWEPPREIVLRVSYDTKEELRFPDGSELRIMYPDGNMRATRVTYLDPTHIIMFGNTWHVRQFTDMCERYPGISFKVMA